MLKHKTLAFKLTLLMLSSCALIFFAAFAYNYAFEKRLLLKSAEENAGNLINATIHRIETVLQRAETMPRNLAAMIEKYPYTRADYIQMVQDVVSHNPDLFGCAISFEPFAFSPDDRLFAPYAYREKGRARLTYLDNQDYNYLDRDWYRIPKQLARSLWSEPYFDAGGGNITMSTFSAPFFKERDGKPLFSGIVSVDLSLSWLNTLVSSIKLYSNGYAFLISQDGNFIARPNRKIDMQETIVNAVRATKDAQLREIGREMLRGQRGFAAIRDPASNQPAWLYYDTLPSSRWALGVVIPEAELFADIHILTLQLVGIGAAGFLLLALAISAIAGRTVRPIRLLAAKTTEISKGNLDVEIPEARSRDEVGELTESFREMRTALKEYINNLAATTAAKERIESELKIAHHIQMSFLPKRFPPFPDKSEFEIFAALAPAKEVGGDLYDFCLLDDNRLFFTIGDVSGKGVPAALFMAVTKTLLKGTAEADVQPSQILTKVNYELCLENEACMFVTVFCGILNFKTGELRYANAGHNPPLLLRAGAQPEWLKVLPGFVLGGMENMKYETMSTQLSPGDGLLLYTDGVTEAVNSKEEFFSEPRLYACVQDGKNLSAQRLVEKVHDAVNDFSSGAYQADDIALLALRLTPRQSYD